MVAGAAPSSRQGAACAWDAAHERAFFFGGYNGQWLGDTWVLGTAGGQFRWTQLVAPGGPAARQVASAVWDPQGARMVLFGGADATTYADAWTLTEANGQGTWTRLVPSGVSPTSRLGAATVWDAAARRLVVFGGYSFAQASYLSDVVVLNLAGASQWLTAAVTGQAPSGRYANAFGWDPDARRLVVSHGANAARTSTASTVHGSPPLWLR